MIICTGSKAEPFVFTDLCRIMKQRFLVYYVKVNSKVCICESKHVPLPLSTHGELTKSLPCPPLQGIRHWDSITGARQFGTEPPSIQVKTTKIYF